MSLLISNSRRRKFLFAAAAIAASGYASYHIYKSSAFSRRRKQLLQIISTMSFFGEAMYQSAESISILSKDFKSFLLSDGDSVPRSLKQAFKIGQCPEFQETVTVLSAALTRGLLLGANAKSRKDGHGNGRGHGHGHGHGEPLKVDNFRALRVRDADAVGEDVACREIREVCFTPKRQEGSKGGCLEYEKEGTSWPSVEKGGSDWQECEIKNYSSGADLHRRRSRKVGIVLDRVRRGQKESKPSEELPDRLLSKLFSEPGVGFASAVVGAVARNFVLAFFDGVHSQSPPTKDPGSSSSSNNQLGAAKSVDKKTPGNAKILDAISTDQCRALIAECIQTFISTAVTVYVDKTKDVNFYDDMVAGITNPSHRDPMKDLMASVCNGAVDTLVRTSYGVMFAEKNGPHGLTHSHQKSHKNQWEIQEYSPHLYVQRQLPSFSVETHCEEITADSNSLEGLIEDACTSGESGIADAQLIANPSGKVSDGNFQGNNMGGMQGFIDGVSKTLAIPSNHKLVVDVARTMTSEAVRSFVDVVVSTTSSHFRTKVHGGWDKVKRGLSDHQGLQLQGRSRDVAVRAFILASICLAVCLHMLTGVRVLQSA